MPEYTGTVGSEEPLGQLREADPDRLSTAVWVRIQSSTDVCSHL